MAPDTSILANVMDIISKVFWIIVKLPLTIWNFIPDWIKFSLKILFIIVGTLMVYWAYKNKNEWKKVYIT